MKSQNKNNDQQNHWANTVAVDTGGIIKTGFLTVGVFMLAFGFWSITFPLASAVVAMGSVIPVGKSKMVQHTSGGTVVKIHAVDGQRIKKGQPIVTLDPIVDRAELSGLQSRYVLLKAMESRLVAEYKGHKEIRFPKHFYRMLRKDTEAQNKSKLKVRYAQLMHDQKSEFEANRQLLKKELSELDQQISSTQGQLKSLNRQKQNNAKQIESLNSQLDRVRPLLKQGYFARNDADELERQVLQIRAEQDQISTEIVAQKFRIDEIRDRKSATIASRRSVTSNELSKTRGELDTLKNEITAANNTLKKLDIRAPASGVLTKSAFHTIGGVIGPREIIAEIVPGGGYKVEARIALKDIDYVQPGQTARVVVTAFNQTLNDPIPATVDYVAADSEFDENSGDEFFIARLVLEESAEAVSQINKLRAGMQSDVFITTGERTFLSYIMKPLTDGFDRAFKEI